MLENLNVFINMSDVSFYDVSCSLQEEGWLMGIKEGTNEKGMFPGNFTKPL